VTLNHTVFWTRGCFFRKAQVEDADPLKCTIPKTELTGSTSLQSTISFYEFPRI
jgi:hypothetical protein